MRRDVNDTEVRMELLEGWPSILSQLKFRVRLSSCFAVSSHDSGGRR